MLSYIGPGIGLATIIMVVVVLLIVLASLGIVLMRPVKRWINKLRKKNGR